jgi:hypothetical protein
MKKLLEAKREIGKVSKNAKNPHFKNTYADVNALLEAVEPILHQHGLLLLQPILDGKVFTQIIDVESGQVIESSLVLPTGLNPQQMGSAVTYYRRYTLQSLLSLQATDDDGNVASTPPTFTATELEVMGEIKMFQTKPELKAYIASIPKDKATESVKLFANNYYKSLKS